MTPTQAPARPFWVLLLQRDSADVLYEAAAMTAAAVSLGIDVTLIWFDAALEALVSGRLSDEESEAGSAGLLSARRGRPGACIRLLRIDGQPPSTATRSRAAWTVRRMPTAISLIAQQNAPSSLFIGSSIGSSGPPDFSGHHLSTDRLQ
jgi:hypothetical protein